MTTRSEVSAALNFSIILGQSIKDAGPEGIPSGHLYSAVSSKGYTYDFYRSAIEFLKKNNVIREDSLNRLFITI